jgi:tetratricopeptide (TPR) repeat protein
MLSTAQHTPCRNSEFEDAMMQGIGQARSGNYANAIHCLERAYTLKKHDPSALIYLGEAYLKTGRLHESIQVFHFIRYIRTVLTGMMQILESLQAIQPKKISGWLLMGSAKSGLGDSAGALIAYNHALEIDKNNVAALVNGGTVLRDLGQLDAALSRLKRACKIAPNIPEAFYNLGDIYYAFERFDEAEKAAQSAVNVSPSMSAAHVLRVIALEGALAHRQALEAAEYGLSLCPKSYGLHYERARMLRLVGDLLEAEEEFKRCTTPSFYSISQGVRPTTVAYAHNEFATLLSQLGREKEARKHWRKSVQVDPTFAQGWVNAAAADDGLEESLSMYMKAVTLSPGLVEAWINIGQVAAASSLSFGH